jgi:rod shape-determining protein MreC
MGLFRRIRDAAACVVLLALPFFFLRSNLKDPSEIGALDRVILEASAPMQYAAAQLARGVSGILQEYVFLVEVKDDNDRLRAENARLRDANQKLAAHAVENRRLRRLLQLRDHLAGPVLSAQVIAKEPVPPFRVTRVRLDRGERDRVRRGMPVLTSDGLVGQIRRAWGRYSDVLLVADRSSAVDVIIRRSGARGMLKGTGSDDRYACRLEKIAREDDVHLSDLVVTSGLGQLFPAGIVVGRIQEVVKGDFGLYQEAIVAPAVQFSRLEEVLILTTGSRAQSVESAPTGEE